MELLYRGDLHASATRTPLRFNGDPTWSWIVIDNRGLMEVLTLLSAKEDLSISHRLAALTYLADLPMSILISAVMGEDVSELRDEFLKNVTSMIDELSRNGTVIRRKVGSLNVGQLRDLKSQQIPELFREFSNQFPALNWKRRWSAMGKLLRIFQNARFQESWNSSVEPPAEWRKWANEILRSRTRRKTPGQRRKSRHS